MQAAPLKTVVKHYPEKMCFLLEGVSKPGEDCPGVFYTKISDKEWNFDHTETPPALQGKGLARIVVEGAFKYCKENGISYNQSTCSYVQKLMNNKL